MVKITPEERAASTALPMMKQKRLVKPMMDLKNILERV
jgi:hypothetical protein